MIRWYLKICGRFASLIGKFDKYSEEHNKFLVSGYACPHCQKLLMKLYGFADVKCYNEEGKPVPLIIARLKGKYFECPKCKYRWKIRKI